MRLDDTNPKISEYLKKTFFKVEVFVPDNFVDKLIRIIDQKNGGRIRDITSITVIPVTTYRINHSEEDFEGTKPGETQKVSESKIEFVVSALDLEDALEAIRINHPYGIASIRVLQIL